jgi:hypothetical protein
MIFFKFQIDNPWFSPQEDFTDKNYYWKNVKLSENKNFEILLSRSEARDILDLNIDLRWWGQDHQGPELDVTLLGFMFDVKIYDSRHWNWEKNRWQTKEETQAEINEYNWAKEQQEREQNRP